MPSAIRQFLILFATFLAQIAMAQAAESALILDIHNDHIEAEISLLQMSENSPSETAHSDLSAYLQTHLSFTTTDGQPMTFELLGLEQTAPKTLRATLFIYPQNDTTPPAPNFATTKFATG